MLLTYLMTAFVVFPLIELWLLLRLAAWMGWAHTLSLVVVTGITGAWLARTQGLQTLRAIQRDLVLGTMPAPRLMDGVMILVAGVLLVTPGLLTDAVGFLLLVPAIRAFVRAWLRVKLERKLRDGAVRLTFFGGDFR